ncbi:cilia- and flagella-associated protein 97 isoform X2 [Esox lucius]|uniref:Cilia- and flagella-associated protein 97 n=1 Tax=Esox lucius TaxID=8010 RepID=A0A3P8ZHI1_ESOLU|nr:cilia- and flagella-associated protein 97 isoform X2 [Esox lucius]
MHEKGVQERTDYAALRGTGAQSPCRGDEVAHFHQLGSARKEFQDPIAKRGVKSQGPELRNKKDGSVEGEVSSIHSKISCDIRTASSAEEQEEGTDDDEDGYHQSQDESEEESGKPSGPRLIPGPKGTHHSHPKKPVRKLRHRSLSPSSSSSGSETDDSYSSGESSSSEPPLSVDMVHPGSPDPHPSLPTTQTFTSSSPRRRPPRLGSAADSKMLHPITVNATMEEEEDTVTDVTPLSTPDGSPVQSLNLGVGRNMMVVEAEYQGAGGVGVRQHQHQGTGGSAATGNLSSIPPEEEGGSCDPDLDLALLSRLGNDLTIHCPSRGGNRKNYSFNNDEVRHIDRENQRLLHQLSLRSRPRSTGATSTNSNSLRRSNGRGGGPPPARLYHSALNRQREQQRIEKENLAFLRRLESVRPTRGMKRAEQLADYQRHAGYLGIATPLPAMDRSSSKMERNTTGMSPGKSPRRGSTNHHQNARTSSTNTPTLLPRYASAEMSHS